MKKRNRKRLSVIGLVVMAVFMFASCLDDDNNKSLTQTVTLTKQEIAVRNQTLTGKWEGKLFFVNRETQKADSAYILWQTDTTRRTVTFDNFPVRVLANYVDDVTLKGLLSKANDEKLVVDYASVTEDYREYYNMYYFRYRFVPQGNKLSFQLEGEPAELTFVESLTNMSNVYNPIAIYYKGVMSGNILIGDIFYKGYSYKLNALLPFSGEQIGK